MQIMLNGFVNGLLLACLALGFSIVYLPTRIFFIALGAVYALAPYIAKPARRDGGGGLFDGWPTSAAKPLPSGKVCLNLEHHTVQFV